MTIPVRPKPDFRATAGGLGLMVLWAYVIVIALAVLTAVEIGIYYAWTALF